MTTIAVSEADQYAVVLGVHVITRAACRPQLGDRFDVTVSQRVDFCTAAESGFLRHLLHIDEQSHEM